MEKLKNLTGQVDLLKADGVLVKEVQTILKQLELYAGDIDGIVGAKTLTAFNDFKEKEYLGRYGILGQSTAKALLDAYDGDREPPKDDSKVVPTRQGVVITGLASRVTASSPIYPGSHFTWGEATKGLTRLPPIAEHTQNIIRIAQVMDDVRDKLGDRPITVTSWLRPVAVNRAVGGASHSRHIVGDGVDFQVQGIPPQRVYQLLNEWYGRKGGLASSNSFTHIDGRGYLARWQYGRGI